MPLFHDMGLIGYHLTPLHFCINQFHINTLDFIRKPLLWLDSLEKYGGTITAGPNFSQTVLLERLKRNPQKRWNLSKVRLVLNGAEPISVDLMQRFMKKMSGFGLDSRAMLPVYGLAEATLAVAFSPHKEEPLIEYLNRQELQKHHKALPAIPEDPSAAPYSSVGFPVQGCEVRIVDGLDDMTPDGTVGHIQVKGDHVMMGYYNNPAATEDAFCGEWLRTGDLGFIHNGRLCITGRAKDILFINGQNYYSHDLENIAQKVNEVDPGQVAFCGQRDSKAESDRLLLFLAGTKPASLLPLYLKIKQQLQQDLGLTVDMMIPIKKRIPKTSSGKMQRYKLLEQYEKGEFDEAIDHLSLLLKAEEARSIQHKVSPQTTTEKLLHRLWYEELLLAPEKVGIHDHFAELGGKSINAASILAELENYHIYLDSGILEKYKTIAEIAGYIDKHPTRVRPTEKGKRKKVFGG